MASYRKRGKKWEYRISYQDRDGKRREKTKSGFRTKAEAVQEAEKIERHIKSGFVTNESVTFVEYMQNWYKVFKKGKNSWKNDRDIEHSINVVKKYFKRMKMKDVSREEYQKFINWYGKGRATATVKKVHIYARMALTEAFQEGAILRNPSDNAIVKGTKEARKADEKYLNYADTQRLIKALKGGLTPRMKSRYMILLSLFTGLRFSEIMGLKWTDIDYEKRTLNVERSFDSYRNLEIAPLKSDSSYRTISLDELTIKLLKEYQLATKKDLGEFLFVKNGRPCASNSAVNKALKKACARANVRRIRFHDLRHTHASLLLYYGVNIKHISQRLGHSNVTITYNVYAHLMTELEEKEDEKINEFMKKLAK